MFENERFSLINNERNKYEQNNIPPMVMEPIASNNRLPVYDVKPRLVAAIKMPARAALSSSKTATAFGSRPLDTGWRRKKNF